MTSPAGGGALPTLLSVLQLASPALPVGGFAYSQGLEQAIEAGVVGDEAAALRWLGDLLEHGLARVEAPLWVCAHDAASAENDELLVRIDRQLYAIRETAELRAETRQMAASLLRVFPALGLDPDAAPIAQVDLRTYPAVFAVACVRLDVGRESGLAAYLWAWLENQVLVVLKCVPLGQMAGQRLLRQLRPVLARAVGAAIASAGDVAAGGAPPAAALVGFALACAAHETQYSRLFRS